MNRHMTWIVWQKGFQLLSRITSSILASNTVFNFTLKPFHILKFSPTMYTVLEEAIKVSLKNTTERKETTKRMWSSQEIGKSFQFE